MTNLIKQTFSARDSYSLEEVRRIVELDRQYMGVTNGFTCCLFNPNTGVSEHSLRYVRQYLEAICQFPDVFGDRIENVRELFQGMERRFVRPNSQDIKAQEKK